MVKYREAERVVHGYLANRELTRAGIAHWWNTTPAALRTIAARELRLMGEYMERVEKARDEARKAAQYGYPDARNQSDW